MKPQTMIPTGDSARLRTTCLRPGLFRSSASALAVAAVVALFAPATVRAQTKWFPGNWVKADSADQIDLIVGNPDFVGAQRNYTWRSIETAPGVYNFNAIMADRNTLAAAGKKLVIRIQTNNFGQSCIESPDDPATPGTDIRWNRVLIPREWVGLDWSADILSSTTCPLVVNNAGLPQAALWRDSCRTALMNLMRALGDAFDDDPVVAGIVFQETALGPYAAPMNPTIGQYRDALLDRMRYTKAAFPRTPVFQNFNFMPNGDGPVGIPLLIDIIAAEKLGGISCPDAQVDSPSMPLHEEYKGVIPLATDNQSAALDGYFGGFFYSNSGGRDVYDMWELITSQLFVQEAAGGAGKFIGRWANFAFWQATSVSQIPNYPNASQELEQSFLVSPQALPEHTIEFVVADRGFPAANLALPLGLEVAPPNKPVATVVGATITLDWQDNSDNESEFEVERRSGAGAFALVATVGANVTSFVDPGLAEGTTYTYRVRAKANSPLNTSSYSLEAAATVGAAADAAVSVSATDAAASEPGANTGTFTFTRTGSTTDSLTVGFVVGGSATNGADYAALPSSVTIPAGSDTATVTVTPLDDAASEPSETVIVTLVSGAGYTVGAPASATVTIVDNDTTVANLLLNNGFEFPLGAEWVPQQGTGFSRVTDVARSGGASLKAVGSGGFAVMVQTIGVSPLHAYTLSCYIRVDAVSGGQGFALSYRWLDANGAAIGAAGFQNQTSVTAGFVQKSASVTAPAAAARLEIRATIRSTTGTAYFDDFNVTTPGGDTVAPVITAPADIVVEAAGAAGNVVNFTATATDDVNGPVPVSASPASGSTFLLGTTTVSLTATDAAGNTAAASFNVTVEDTVPPVLTVPADIVVEAEGPVGAPVNYTVTATDNIEGSLPVLASIPSGSVFPLGTTTVSLEATDTSDNTVVGSFKVTVRDTTAPVLASLTASPDVLWPANHKMVPVTLTATVSDAVGVVSTRIIAVASSEPGNGGGDGNPEADWEITGDLTLKLRAERAGGGPGRIYTITVESRDAAGNTATGTTTVTVPHSQGG